ncbi:MAG: hypothetical protein KIS78_22045 [Labilithrix sp.]|nr:hypothetical protein [Labilithrix sp.]MCW5835097.1 hypothetical protein [Labilithrix sp.]
MAPVEQSTVVADRLGLIRLGVEIEDHGVGQRRPRAAVGAWPAPAKATWDAV